MTTVEDFETTGTEQEFLKTYQEKVSKKEYPAFALTADIVLLTIRQGKLCALMVKRGGHPFKDHWALPGGFVNIDESAEEAAVRELEEESGVKLERAHIEQLRTYSTPDRDPRMRVVSTAFIALIPEADLPPVNAGDDAVEAHFFPVHDLLSTHVDNEDRVELAFDHEQILRDGLERTAGKIEYTNLAATMLEEPFTLADLRRVYEEVWGVQIHAANFRRKILSTADFIRDANGKGESKFSGGRSAQLYSRGDAVMLQPPILRSEQ